MSGQILVTGATTPLGKAVLATLGDRGVAAVEDTVAFDGASSDAIRVPSDGRVDPTILAGMAGIVNCAARVTGGVADLIRANVDYPVHLATAARHAGVPCFIQEGSLSVFGPIERITPDSPIAPVTDYACSRVVAEKSLAALDGDGFATRVLRVPFLFSAAHPGMLGALITAMARLRVVPTHAAAPTLRSMMTHADAAELMVTLVTADATVKRLAAAADREPVDLTAIATAIGAVTGRRVLRMPVPAALIAIGRAVAPGAVNALFRSSVLADTANLRATGSEHSVRAEIDIYLARLRGRAV